MEYVESKMQEYMEAGEHLHDHFVDEANVPTDYCSPNWEDKDKVHNWRNYASEQLKDEWGNFSTYQKMVIAGCLNDFADTEEWE